eukprot:INCI14682.1.p1 GENE.INCI14682.1~~INCI14682.1.p1  ORF type:complete len:523 (-),score=116.09 INCI14682.1:29-1597(-)
MSKVPCAIVVAGRLDDYKFHMAKAIALDLARRFEQVTVQHYGLLEVDWLDYLNSKLKELSGDGISHRTSPLVFYNTVNYIGGEQDLINWALRAYKYNASEAFVNKEGYQELNTVLFRRLAKKEYAAWLQSQKSQFVYMDFEQGGKKPLGRVVFELFASVLPQTCQNFVELCTGANGTSANGTALTYQGSKIHRAVKDTWIQGGDICTGAGDAGESARGGLLPDENFSVKHDKAGVLAMANSGPHSNHSQFYVTLLPMPWLDTRNVAFGRVIQGMRTVNLISKTRTLNQRPLEDVVIARCGLFVGGEDGGALAASAKRPVTQRALLKQVFSDATKADPRQSCRHSELLLALGDEASTLRSKFAGQADIVIAAVEKDAIASDSELITSDHFVKVAMAALSAQRGKSTPQRKLDEALEVDAQINAAADTAAASQNTTETKAPADESLAATVKAVGLAPANPASGNGGDDQPATDGPAASDASELAKTAQMGELVPSNSSSNSNNNDGNVAADLAKTAKMELKEEN